MATRPPIDETTALRVELEQTLDRLRAASDRLRRQEALLDQAGAEVAAQMQRYRELFDFAPDGYLVTGGNGIIEEANRAAARLLHVGTRELIGKPLVVYVAAPDRRRLLRMLREAIADPAVHEAEILLHPRDNRVTPVSVQVAAASSDETATVRWLLHDMSRRRDTEQQLEDALQREREVAARLRDMDGIKNAFLLAVSHDLRGPVTAIVSLARLLGDEATLSADHRRRIVDSIAANAARVEHVQRNLVDLDRLARHAIALQPAAIDVAEVVSRCVASADATDRSVSTHVGVPQAVLDGSVVERILDNLLSNAVSHTPAQTPIEVSAEPEGDGVVFTVADHGRGVPAALRQIIFDPAGAAVLGRDQTGPRAGGGGLHLVSRFAELHGGRAWVDETPGGGASFRVLLREHG